MGGWDSCFRKVPFPLHWNTAGLHTSCTPHLLHSGQANCMQSVAGGDAPASVSESGHDKLSLGKAVSRNPSTWDKNVSLSLSPSPRGLCPPIVWLWSLG